MVLYGKDHQNYGRESSQNIMKVWKGYTFEDAIIVTKKKGMKTIKPEIINFWWRKLWLDTMIKPSKEIMKKFVDMAKKL